MNEFETVADVYSNGLDIATWENENLPDENLIHKSGPHNQCERIKALAVLLGGSPKIVESHRSKSVKLPVACFKFTIYNEASAYAFIRDNFYDVRVSIVSELPLHIPYRLVHQEVSNEEYEAERDRCKGYSIMKGKSPEDNLKTALSLLTDEWMEHWSHRRVLRKDNKIWFCNGCHEVYHEGINKLPLPSDTFRVYESGFKNFSIQKGGLTNIALILDYVKFSLADEIIKTRNR